ncbi:MAG: glycoside hydrolase family 95 protein [Firmicutes bacterium]|nr:glycoside hydrolase family 95 protein [Bacillota bacterium]
MRQDPSHKNTLVLRYPSSWWSNPWRDVLPSGNGCIGAAVYGGIHRETVLINHHGLWHGGLRDPLPDVSDTLSRVRVLMDQKQYHEANWILANALKEQGYQNRMASPLPLGDLRLNMAVSTGFTNYRRMVNMETGEVCVTWDECGRQFERKLFVSRADNLIAYIITGGGLNCSLKLGMHEQDHPKRAEYQESEAGLADDQYLYYAVQHPDGTDFGAVARVIVNEGETAAADGWLVVKGAAEILVLIKVFVSGRRHRAWQRLQQELAAEARSYQQLLEAHCQIHSRLFNAVKLDLKSSRGRTNEELLLAAYEGSCPTELVEKMWAYGRYLFISAADESSYPMHMYGLWVGSYRAIWSHYMANENIQMMYWHALGGGLAHFIRAVYQYCHGLMEDFRENACKLFGCRGIFIPAGTTPLSGLPSQVVPVILNWTGAAGWLAQHFYQYWLYTGDDTFLETKALPFMRETALFYEDFLVEGDDGYFRIYPSVSPENSPRNYITPEAQALGHPMPTAVNATMDFAIIKELLTNLIAGSEHLGIYDAEREKWRDMLAKIPPYQINADGAVREWMAPDFEDNYNHRHLSHLYPLFPGHEITQDSDPELYQAFCHAVQKRLAVGIGDQTGWSLAHMASIYARLEDGDKALECLELLSRSCLINNFFTLHNDWRSMGITLQMPSAPIQLDANLGWAAAVQEMLLYASPELIKILPACPGKWEQGQVEGLRFCTGAADISWNRGKGELKAVLTAERPTQAKLKLPEGYGEYELACSKGSVQRLDKSSCWRIELPAGAQLLVCSKS